MKIFVIIWLVLSAFVALEYRTLTRNPEKSILVKMQQKGLIKPNLVLNTEPGRPFSLWLGYAGFGLMIIMNVYSMRKRFSFLGNAGELGSWLNFHIFCGLFGPTLIFFHCDFKVRGIVGISFWSMVISFSSGIVGRYFYLQLMGLKSELETLADQYLFRLDKILEVRKIVVTPELKEKVLKHSIAYVGGAPDLESPSPLAALFGSFAGDLRVRFSNIPVPAGWPEAVQPQLKEYAVHKRKSQFLILFQKLMGYWHTFHFPFAIFMYVAAVIHIISSLIFLRVK